jgi:hypothetical protein
MKRLIFLLVSLYMDTDMETDSDRDRDTDRDGTWTWTWTTIADVVDRCCYHMGQKKVFL